MNRIFLSRNNGAEYHAGSKARNDAERIVEMAGYKRRTASCTISIKAVRRIINILRYPFVTNIKKDTIVFTQYPDFSEQFYNILFQKKKNNGFHIITLVHDLSVRADETVLNNLNIQKLVLDNSDVIICHNEKMKAYLISEGIDEFKIVCLEIFDYLYITDEKQHEYLPEFLNHIVVAGNLDPKKCGYIDKLFEISSHLYFDLYGVNYSNIKHDNVEYHGAFSPDELPGVLNKPWGLVWDGAELNTCAGKIGNYLRINNPHKTSLYIAAGIPIIIWKEAALAEFVEKHNIGLTVSSLYELESELSRITIDEYSDKLKNIKRIQKYLTEGHYLKNAVYKCENILMTHGVDNVR